MKIMQAMAGAEFGGAEEFFVRLATAFGRSDMEQRVLVRPIGGRNERLKQAGVDVRSIDFGGALDLPSRLAFRREIRHFKPDVVMTWMNRATQFCPKGKFVHVARLGGYYDLKYYRNCDHLIGNTQDIVDYLVNKGWPAERAHYVPNFVLSEKAEPVSRSLQHTPDGAPLFLAMGRLHQNKAFDVLLNALVKLPEAYLWLAGEGPLRSALMEQAERIGVRPRVRFLGWRSDMPALMAAADYFVCPSRHEPLGNVVIEGWAHGCPVIAADSLGPGMLIDNGVNGMLAPVDNSDELARQMKRVMQDDELAQKLANAGWKKYRAEFTEEVVVGKYKEFFEKVIG
jgi:glycosyltransferase involved in cell wall biosynthesis